MKEFIIKPHEAGQKLDRYLMRVLNRAPRGFLYKMLRKKNIVLNDKKADGHEILQEQDRVTIYFSDETFDKFSGLSKTSVRSARPDATTSVNSACENAPATADSAGEGALDIAKRAYKSDLEPVDSACDRASDVVDSSAENRSEKRKAKKTSEKFYPLLKSRIIYEDTHILVIDKPSGLLSQKAGPEDYSANDFVLEYLLDTGQLQESDLPLFHPSICNRLDRNTSGLLIAGKTMVGLQTVNGMLRDRTIKKYYHCVVVGKVSKDVYLKGYLEKDPKTNTVKIYTEQDLRDLSGQKDRKAKKEREPAARLIETSYHPLCSDGRFTLLEVHLITGRSHQIRAHLASCGTPVLGDPKYGNLKINKWAKATYGVEHQLLHACRMEFPDGRSFTAEDPEIFSKVLP